MKTNQNLRRIIQLFSLESELESNDKVYEEIKKGIVFRGTNLWILIFAIIVASVGLNMNSTAVIIGAMLISPLMGPINGMGYSIATYDMLLFKRSLKNFSFAIIASLVASTAYFALSPVSTAHSELLARTSPTIYDVLIALFGGLAGIVAISSKQKGNVIPGVAIATALMPPLCTAGYGLATGQFDFFFGAFYLFTINTIFIATASVWVSQLLKFPIRSIVDERKKKKINSTITLIILMVLLPSIFFGYNLVKQEDFTQKANQYILNVTIFEGNYLLKNRIDPVTKTISLVYGGSTLTESQKKDIIEKSKTFKIKDANIEIQQGLTFDFNNESNSELFQYKEQIVNLNSLLAQKNSEIDSLLGKSNFGKVILNEIQALFPEIKTCLYSESTLQGDKTKSQTTIPIVVFSSQSNISNADKIKIKKWLKSRLKNENVQVFYQ